MFFFHFNMFFLFFRLVAENFNDLLDAIIDLFPNEEKYTELYYKPYCTITVDDKKSKKLNSSGYLYNAYTSFRDRLGLAGLLPRTVRLKTGTKGIFKFIINLIVH